MSNEDYRKFVLSLENKDYTCIANRLSLTSTIRLLHGIMGIEDEAGELTGALKKHILYGKKLDHVDVLEEVGDLLFYIELVLDECGYTLADARRANVAKLQARYGSAFSESRAINRDVNAERASMNNALTKKCE